MGGSAPAVRSPSATAFPAQPATPHSGATITPSQLWSLWATDVVLELEAISSPEETEEAEEDASVHTEDLASGEEEAETSSDESEPFDAGPAEEEPRRIFWPCCQNSRRTSGQRQKLERKRRQPRRRPGGADEEGRPGHLRNNGQIARGARGRLRKRTVPSTCSRIETCHPGSWRLSKGRR